MDKDTSELCHGKTKEHLKDNEGILEFHSKGKQEITQVGNITFKETSETVQEPIKSHPLVPTKREQYGEILSTLTEVFENLPDIPSILESSDDGQTFTMGLAHVGKIAKKISEASKEVETQKEWVREYEEKVKRGNNYLKTVLEDFMLNYYEKTQKQTLKLANGVTLKLTKSRDKVEIENEAAAILWAKQLSEEDQKEIVKKTESILKKGVMDYYKKNGELPNGIVISEGGEFIFNVK